jgi:hypothetical protein
MDKKIPLIVVLFTLVMVLIPISKADIGFTPNTVNVYLWVDKTQYNPGDTITLYFTIYNARSYNITIDQVDIRTPWFTYNKDHWEGNQTMTINKTVTAGSTYSDSTTIPIPNDGRATAFNSSADISVAIKTDTETFNEQIAVGISNPPVHMAVQDMNMLVLLVAVLIILIVVCTALIAAAIFLSARKPQEAYPPPSQSTP